jgi:hypothetical protein
MSQLLTDKDQPLHKAQAGDSLSTVARALTRTVLSRLDGGRKRSVLEFLYESRLIDQGHALRDEESNLIKRRHNIVSLERADLSGADLSRAQLPSANLSVVDLSGADLNKAILSGTDLSGANLRDAEGLLPIFQLTNVKSLEGATMRNGQPYEDWLETPEGQHWFKTYREGRGEDGENSGPS